MPAGRLLQTSLNGGEFSKRARGRSDLQAYFPGADIIENVFPLAEGPAMRRPGFEFIAEVKDSAKKTALIPFTRSIETTVMVEAGEAYFRFYDGDTLARLENGGGPIELATPYSQAQANNLYTAQSADVMWFCVRDSSAQPRALLRYADDDWAFNAYATVKGPYQNDTFDAGTITATSVTGNVTLNASMPIFTPGETGGRVRLYSDGRGVPFEKWQAEEGKADNSTDDDIASGALREHDGRVYQASGGGIASNQPPVHESGTLPDGGGEISWTYLHDLSGTVKITNVVSETQAQGTVEERLPQSTSTNAWALGAFSSVQGWPKIVGVYEERLFFASTIAEPDTLFLSRTNGYNETDADFKPSAGNGEVVDDHAIRRTLADNEVNAPGWAIADDGLVLGTSKGLIRISGPSPTEPLTPAGAVARRIPGSKSASRKFRGFQADNGIVYASTGGAKLYHYRQGGDHRHLTALASHVGDAELVKGVWCGEPYNRMFILRADGRLWACTLEDEQKVTAFARVTPGGQYAGGAAIVEDIAMLKDARGFERLWAIVKRTVNGAAKRTIERLRLDWRMEPNLVDEAFYVDAGVEIDLWNKDAAKTITVTAAADAAPGETATLTAIGHAPFTGLEGKTVAVRIVTPAEPNGGPVAIATQIRIDTVTSASEAEGTFVIGVDEAGTLVNTAIADWAIMTNTFTGLSHMEGETIGIQIDGMNYGEAVVAGGAVTLDDVFARGVAGFAPSWRVRSLPLALRFNDGTSKGEGLSLTEAYVTMAETGPEEANVRVIEDKAEREADPLGGRSDLDLMGMGPPAIDFGQKVELANYSGVHDVQIEIFGGGVLPATIESIMARYEA